MKVFCPTCGYGNEAGLGTSLTCTSCGATFTLPGAQPERVQPLAPVAQPPLMHVPKAGAPYHPAAIAALVLGILCCVPFSGIGAIISGAIALKAIAQAEGQYRGRELAIAGMVLAAASIAFTLLGIILQLVQPHR